MYNSFELKLDANETVSRKHLRGVGAGPGHDAAGSKGRPSDRHPYSAVGAYGRGRKRRHAYEEEDQRI